MGDPKGIRWGSSGDPHANRGIRNGIASARPTFWGDPSERTAAFYNIKKGQKAAWAVGMWDGAPWGLGDEGRGLALCSKILGAHVLGAIATIGKGVTKTFRGIDS